MSTSTALFGFLVFLGLTGCLAMDNRVDHSFEIANGGATGIVRVVYVYGDLGQHELDVLNVAGDSITGTMHVPETFDVRWVTEPDGKLHKAHIPLGSEVSPGEVKGNAIRVFIDGPVLKVSLVKRLPNFMRDEKQLFTVTNEGN